MKDDRYVLGHTTDEIRRLELQSQLLESPTRHVLERVGLAKGMRVLDIGTGAGDVAALAAEFVGPGGHVLAIDRNPEVLARARSRFGQLGQIDFELRAAEDEERLASYDLVIGRYVACFQKDEVGFLRAMARRVVPGGTIAFIEPATPLAYQLSHPPVALYDETFDWIVKAFGVGGARVDIGTRCVAWFKGAGLGEPSMLQEVPVAGPSSVYCEWLSLTMQSLAPALERAGLVKVEDFDLPTLRARMQDAVTAADAQMCGPPTVGAWAKVG